MVLASRPLRAAWLIHGADTANLWPASASSKLGRSVQGLSKALGRSLSAMS